MTIKPRVPAAEKYIPHISPAMIPKPNIPIGINGDGTTSDAARPD